MDSAKDSNGVSGDFPDMSGDFDGGKEVLRQSRHFTIERVNDKQTLEQEWEPLLVEIFPDEGDREPIELLNERLENGENFFLMRDETGRAVGMELSQIMLDSDEPDAKYKAMYVPWTGVVEECRNNGIGSQMNRQISEYMRENYGTTHTLIDIEDPDRLHDSGYAPEELDEAIGFAERRINFWRREGFVVVDDESKQSGDKLEYVRPASDDEQNIQGYDHLTVRLENDALEAEVLSADGMEIDKDFVRECYLDMTRIQYGNHSEDELREMFPAVNQYLNDIDAVQEPTLKLRSSAITPKRTPDADIVMTMKSDAQIPVASYDTEEGYDCD